MSHFKAKMHQIRFRRGLRPRPRWGSLQRSATSPSWIFLATPLTGGKPRHCLRAPAHAQRGASLQEEILIWRQSFRGVATGVYHYPPPNQSTLNVFMWFFVSLTHLYPPKSNSWLRTCRRSSFRLQQFYCFRLHWLNNLLQLYYLH